jgi:hypothetical protein
MYISSHIACTLHVHCMWQSTRLRLQSRHCVKPSNKQRQDKTRQDKTHKVQGQAKANNTRQDTRERKRERAQERTKERAANKPDGRVRGSWRFQTRRWVPYQGVPLERETETRQDKTHEVQGQAKANNTRQDKTRQDTQSPRSGKGKQHKTRHTRTKERESARENERESGT